MNKYRKSNVKGGTTRAANLTFIVDGGASWAINRNNLSAEWIDIIESMLVVLCEHTDDAQNDNLPVDKMHDSKLNLMMRDLLPLIEKLSDYDSDKITLEEYEAATKAFKDKWLKRWGE
jgi:hypothetical protein